MNFPIFLKNDCVFVSQVEGGRQKRKKWTVTLFISDMGVEAQAQIHNYITQGGMALLPHFRSLILKPLD